MPDPVFLTIAQAAEELTVSPRYIERLIRSGVLPVHRFGRSVRIKRSTLHDLAESAAAAPLPSREPSTREEHGR